MDKTSLSSIRDKEKDNVQHEGDNDNKVSSKKAILQTIVNKALKSSKPTINRVGSFIEAILTQDFPQLRRLSAQGIPDDISILRSLIWKINLGYLSIDNEEWDKTLETQRKTYNHYKQIFISKLKDEIAQYKDTLSKTQDEIDSFEAASNKTLLEEICKDVNRTHMQFSFFFQPASNDTKLSLFELQQLVDDRRNCTLKNIENTYKVNISETHADVIARILFIYCKFSPDISYVQGMNEIIAPIYYCYSNDKVYENESSVNVEADSFWSFYSLMEQLKCVFNRENDHDEEGIMNKAKRLELMIIIVDKQIFKHLIRHKVELSYFCFRWMILLYSQDFNMLDIMRLWDLILSEENKFTYVYYVALAVIEIKRDSILVKGCSDILSELQLLNTLDIETIICKAIEIKSTYGKEIEEIMYCSITNKEKILEDLHMKYQNQQVWI